MLTGRITEWNRDRGFGYLESEGRRVFLHIREFKERHKAPEVGDVINFVMGSDRQGRPCAKDAIHANDGGRLRLWHFWFLAALLMLPFVAVYRIGGFDDVGYAVVWLLLFSGLTYCLYAWDKHQAREKGRRENETTLHLAEVLGGWPGAFIAQRRLRHKSSKGRYQFVFVLIIGLHQFIAIDALRGWPFFRLLIEGIRKLWGGMN